MNFMEIALNRQSCRSYDPDRPVEAEKALDTAHRWLSGSRESDGFNILADKRHLELSLEALVIDKRFTALFTDDEANTALQRLLAAGYLF